MEQYKIVVLDDDPTGIQTVHGVYVYTDWSEESIRAGFTDGNPMFFLLTNSRGLTAIETRQVHRQIGERVVKVSKETGIPFILVSRGDSTLRGHYPLETETLRETLEESGDILVDGEILCPFFPEGGRYTIGDVHYVVEETRLVPAGETEFAKDRTFGYHSSDLKDWVEEKSSGTWKADTVVSVSIDELRHHPAVAEDKLMSLHKFQKLIVNAAEYRDLEVFAAACMNCIRRGKTYLLRTAAALPKVLGGIEDQELLSGEQLADPGNPCGGLIMVGSHVAKTTRQLEALKKERRIKFIEFDVALAAEGDRLGDEKERVVQEVHKALAAGITAAVYTSRKRLELGSGNREDELRLSVKISEAVTDIVSSLQIRPSFLIAKGGITSSDIGTKGLKVKRAMVLGQVLPGIPVWKTGSESRFPGLSYVIFPGNVGSDTALYEVYRKIAE